MQTQDDVRFESDRVVYIDNLLLKHVVIVNVFVCEQLRITS